MRPDYHARAHRAEKAAGPREGPGWNEAYVQALAAEGLRLDTGLGLVFEGTDGPLGAPECIPGAAYGWPAGHVIVEVEDRTPRKKRLIDE